MRAELEIPAEETDPGPRGYRVHVIDVDTSTGTHYTPHHLEDSTDDPFAKATDRQLLTNPHFHAQNVYAVVMHTLARFEFALGRRVAWSFGGHQLKVAPHAFADANAFYSERDEGIFFGYFMDRGGRSPVFTCLSHDIVAHETAHATLDGLRSRYTDPSSPDQAGFHEGFADLVALLSVFSLRDVVDVLVAPPSPDPADDGLVSIEDVTEEALMRRSLLGLAEQMGEELQNVRGSALRRSIQLKPSKAYLEAPEFQEPHRRGEILVAAILRSFLGVWVARISTLGTIRDGHYSRERVVEEGSEIADRLLTIIIRALDYAPPVDLSFGDYLSALLTADQELYRDDSKYQFRQVIPAWFARYGISPGAGTADGAWERAPQGLNYGRSHFEPLQRDRDEVFRFVWENRDPGLLNLYPGAFAEVQSVRPCVRQGQDGFFLRETVAEYVEILTLHARELGTVRLRQSEWTPSRGRERLRPPEGMDKDQVVRLYGGGTLIFDEFGQLRYHVKNRIDSPRQQDRLDYLWSVGAFHPEGRRAMRFQNLHLRRAAGLSQRRAEGWV